MSCAGGGGEEQARTRLGGRHSALGRKLPGTESAFNRLTNFFSASAALDVDVLSVSATSTVKKPTPITVPASVRPSETPVPELLLCNTNLLSSNLQTIQTLESPPYAYSAVSSVSPASNLASLN